MVAHTLTLATTEVTCCWILPIPVLYFVNPWISRVSASMYKQHKDFCKQILCIYRVILENLTVLQATKYLPGNQFIKHGYFLLLNSFFILLSYLIFVFGYIFVFFNNRLRSTWAWCRPHSYWTGCLNHGLSCTCSTWMRCKFMELFSEFVKGSVNSWTLKHKVLTFYLWRLLRWVWLLVSLDSLNLNSVLTFLNVSY